MINPNEIGQGRQYPEAINAYDAQAGKYNDAINAIPTADKLPTQQFPMAPAPAPFVIKSK